MLPKSWRIRLEKDFDRIFSKGRSIHATTMSIKYLPSSLDNPRFGFLVSNKISKRATQRNIIKRRLRAIVAKHAHDYKKAYDVVVLTRPPILTRTYAQMEEEFLVVCNKLSIL